MTSNEQRAALQRQIWAIANDVRGAVDGWDFKQYVLGSLFYRFISENFIDYITGGDPAINYAAMADDDQNIAAGNVISEVLADEAVEQAAEHVLLEVPAIDGTADVIGDGPDLAR